MPIGMIFWMLFIIAIIFHLIPVFRGPQAGTPVWYPLGGSAFLLVELFLLGWKVFGFVAQ